MTVGSQTFTGKGAREEAGRALARAILSRRDEYAPRARATIKGFEILSRDKPGSVRPGPVHSRRRNLRGSYQCRQSRRHHTEHRTHAARPRQDRRGRTASYRTAGKNADRLSGPGQPAIRARCAVQGIARPPGPAQRRPRPRQERRPGRGTGRQPCHGACGCTDAVTQGEGHISPGRERISSSVPRP